MRQMQRTTNGVGENASEWLESYMNIGKIDGFHVDFVGWDVHWTGWKSSHDNDLLIGQWVAYKDGKCLYASVQGGQGEYEPCSSFDISHYKGQPVITAATPLGVALEAMEEGWERLKALIREVDGQRTEA